jgi:subtilase family serine protease
MYLEMEGRQGNCVEAYTPYGIRVVVENVGLASAGPFVVDLNGTQQQVDGGLAAGQFIELHFTGTAPSGQYEAHADATDHVVEDQEDNNSLSFLAPTPTPPLLCTATPTPTP